VAIDFELTGLDARRDEVVSFGAVPVIEGRASLARALYREVRPTVPSSVAAVKVHGLRTQDLRTAPPIEEAARELAGALAGRFVLAWFADVEVAFLRRLYGGSDRWWRRRTIDVLDLVRGFEAADDGAPKPLNLAATAARFGLPLEDAHHALGDAVMTAELFLVLAPRAAAQRGDRVRDLLHAVR
jgi:DNA polymerase-3 subunit epsilon